MKVSREELAESAAIAGMAAMTNPAKTSIPNIFRLILEALSTALRV